MALIFLILAIVIWTFISAIFSEPNQTPTCTRDADNETKERVAYAVTKVFVQAISGRGRRPNWRSRGRY